MAYAQALILYIQIYNVVQLCQRAAERVIIISQATCNSLSLSLCRLRDPAQFLSAQVARSRCDVKIANVIITTHRHRHHQRHRRRQRFLSSWRAPQRLLLAAASFNPVDTAAKASRAGSVVPMKNPIDTHTTTHTNESLDNNGLCVHSNIYAYTIYILYMHMLKEAGSTQQHKSHSCAHRHARLWCVCVFVSSFR